MNTNEKMAVLLALDSEVSIQMREDLSWYVLSDMEIAEDGIFTSAFGNGATPEEAISDQFRQYCEELPAKAHIRCRNNRVRWNGFMWKEHIK